MSRPEDTSPTPAIRSTKVRADMQRSVARRFGKDRGWQLTPPFIAFATLAPEIENGAGTNDISGGNHGWQRHDRRRDGQQSQGCAARPASVQKTGALNRSATHPAP